MMFPLIPLTGAEDGDPVEPEPTTQVPEEAPGEPPAGDVFPREYVEQLRRENAGYRTKLREVEEEVKARKQAEMSEIEKATSIAADASKEAATLQAKLAAARVEMAVTRHAYGMNFNDVNDALELIDINSLELDESGDPTDSSVKGALKKLLDKKPYLAKTAMPVGSGDGAPQGTPHDPTSFEARKAEHMKTLASQGYVPRDV